VHFNPMIKGTQRCPWGPLSGELRDALGGHDQASRQMYFGAMILPTCRPCSSGFADSLRVCDPVRLEYLEVVDLEVADFQGGATAAETLYIG